MPNHIILNEFNHFPRLLLLLWSGCFYGHTENGYTAIIILTELCLQHEYQTLLSTKGCIKCLVNS